MVVYILLTWDYCSCSHIFRLFHIWIGVHRTGLQGNAFFWTPFAVSGSRKAPATCSSAQELNLHALNLHLEKIIFVRGLERGV